MGFKPLLHASFDDKLDVLPWANKWVKTADDYTEPRRVEACQVYDTGILVATQEYKAYIHEGTTLYAHVVEALKVWTLEGKQFPSLEVRVNKKGKPELGLNEDVLNHRWFKAENRYVQIAKKLEAELEEDTSVNPLLAGSGVHTIAGKRDVNLKSLKNSRS